MSRSDVREQFLQILSEVKSDTITKAEIMILCEEHGLKSPQWFTKDPSNKVGRGLYKVVRSKINVNDKVKQLTETNDSIELSSPIIAKKVHIQNLTTSLEEQGIIPDKYKNYVPFGNFEDLKSIIASKKFYPVFITGPSGNGKSMSVEQVCAQLKREFICYSMTDQTDETDLLGGYVLINNEMVWRDGPVTVAARRGAVLCIDEIDYGNQNLSPLQRVLEGKPFLLKKKGEIVHPTEGFQIVATANTKGKGSENGRYIFTNILNEAFLERFPITFEQEWAPVSVENKIIKKELEDAGKPDEQFSIHLITWATTIRKAYIDEGADEVISTRRLVHIAKAYSIFGGDRLKSISYCLNRFDEDTKKSFIDLYTKIDDSVVVQNEMVNETISTNEVVNVNSTT